LSRYDGRCGGVALLRDHLGLRFFGTREPRETEAALGDAGERAVRWQQLRRKRERDAQERLALFRPGERQTRARRGTSRTRRVGRFEIPRRGQGATLHRKGAAEMK